MDLVMTNIDIEDLARGAYAAQSAMTTRQVPWSAVTELERARYRQMVLAVVRMVQKLEASHVVGDGDVQNDRD